MNFFMVGASIWALLLWVHLAHFLPQKRAIIGCQHTRGQLTPAVPNQAGRPTALIWICRDCPLQIPLKVHALPRKLWIRVEDLKEFHDRVQS